MLTTPRGNPKDELPSATAPRSTSMADLYGYAYHRVWELGEHAGHVLLDYQLRDGSTFLEDAANYFLGPEFWWEPDVWAVERAAGRVLDIGCGVGRHAVVLAERGNDVVGIDPSPEAVTIARHRGVTAVVGDLSELPTEIGTFDTFVLAGGNLDLLLAFGPEETLSRLAAIANPGAQLLGSAGVELDEDGNLRDPGPVAAYAMRLRVRDGAEFTEWSPWSHPSYSPPTRLPDIVRGTAWEVEDIRYAEPARVSGNVGDQPMADCPEFSPPSSYLACLRLIG